MRRHFAPIVALSLIITPPAAAAQSTTVGVANQANAAPFGFLAGATRYQQIYAASAFAGPLTIGRVSFFHTQFIDGNYAPGTFVLRLGTTRQTITGLGLDFAANATGPLQPFAMVMFGNTREQATTTIAGAPFMYDPGAGNLLLDILYSGPLIGDTPAQFDADGTGAVTRRVYGITSGFGYDNIALVTRFDAATMTAPEPGTWALLGVGLVGLGGVTARRRQGRKA